MVSGGSTSAQRAFLSYRHADRERGKMLARDLSLRGVDIWYDEWGSTVGKKVTSMLEEAVKSSGWFLIVFTRRTLESRWVRWELERARCIEQESGRPKIIPCVFEEMRLPHWVEARVFADFRTDYRVGFTKLLECIGGTTIRNEYQALQELDGDRSQAGVLFRQGKYPESKCLYEQCLKQFEKARGQILLSLAQIAFNQYKFQESIRLVTAAQKIFLAQGDLRGETDALQYLAHHYGLMRKYKQARQCLKAVLDRTRGRPIHSWNLMRSGMIEIEARNYSRAWSLLCSALHDFRHEPEEKGFGVSATKYLMARVRMCQGKCDRAIVLLREALPYSERSKDRKGACYTRLRLGECLLRTRRFSEAVGEFARLRSLLRTEPDGNLTLEAERLLLQADFTQCPENLLPVLLRLRARAREDARAFPNTRALRKSIGVRGNSTLIEGV